MSVFLLKAIVRQQSIRVQVRTGFDVDLDFGLQNLLAPIRYNYGMNLAMFLRSFGLQLSPRSSTPKTAVLSLGPASVILRFLTSMCILRALPPMKVSSTSHSPVILLNEPVCMALRIRCIMNHAVLCVTPRTR